MEFLLGVLGKYVGGPLGAVATWFLDYVIRRLKGAINEYFDKLKARKKVREAVKRYEEAKTPDEQERALDDLSQL